MGRGLYVDHLPSLRLARDRASREGGARHRGYTSYRAHETYQGREIVRPHVEQGAAALFVIELRRGMPAFVAVAEHEGVASDRLAYRAVVDQLATGLQPGPEKGVGGGSQQ